MMKQKEKIRKNIKYQDDERGRMSKRKQKNVVEKRK